MIRLLAIIFLWIGKTGCWNIVAGYTGYIDFGAVGYFGIGSYVTALLMAKGTRSVSCFHFDRRHRFRLDCHTHRPAHPSIEGAYFGIATLAFAEAMKQIILEFDKTVGINFFDGPHGITLPIGPGNEFFYYVGLWSWLP